MYLQLRKRKRWIIALLLPFLLVSCSEIRLIGAYDQTIDEGIQKAAKDISTLLVRIEKNIGDGNSAANDYALFRETYIDIEGEVETIKIRAGALPKYGKVKSQIDLILKNIQNLEMLHKLGFVQPGKPATQVVKDVKDLFEVAFTAMLAAQNGLKREKTDKSN